MQWSQVNEPRHEETGVVPVLKQRCRSVLQLLQHLCFHFTDSSVALLFTSDFKLLAFFCDGTDWFVSDLIGTD